MADENEGSGNGDAKDEVIAKLNEQIENLNKGIATYRDDAKSAKEEASKAATAAQLALTQLDELKKLGEKQDDGIKLTAAEEARIEAYAKKNGLVSKADLDQQRAQAAAEQVKAYENQAVAEFLEKHPEYDEDGKWKDIAEEFKLYRAPATLQGFRQLLERIRKDVSGEAQKGAAAKARAEVISRNRTSIGGGSSGAGDAGEEEEMEKLTKRYPNLTREQITGRLAELRSLPKKK